MKKSRSHKSKVMNHPWCMILLFLCFVSVFCGCKSILWFYSLRKKMLHFTLLFQTRWFLLGSPIWKPRDSGVAEFPQFREGVSRDPPEVRTRSRGAGDRPPSRSEQQRHTVGFESPHSNAKKESLQSACKRK